MAIGITIRDRTPELFQKLEAAIGRFVVKGAAYIHGQLVIEGGKAKSGGAYKRGGNVHIASAPGESPATDSANLYPSIEVIIAQNRLEAKIGTPVEHAIWLEEGTGRMDARPLWEPVEKDSLPTLNKILEAEIGKGRGLVTSTYGV